MAAFFSCKGCTERHVGCHATCEKYIAEKAENDRIREEAQKHRNSIHLNSNGTMYSGRNSGRSRHYGNNS